MSLFLPYWTEMHLAKSFLLSWCDLLCYSGDLMWCIIRTSVSARICQEMLGLLARGWACHRMQKQNLSSDCFTSDNTSLSLLPLVFLVETLYWHFGMDFSALHCNRLVEESEEADLEELAGGLLWHEQITVLPSSCWSINDLCLWCLVSVRGLWISY